MGRKNCFQNHPWDEQLTIWQRSWQGPDKYHGAHIHEVENLSSAKFSLYSMVRLIFKTLMVVFHTKDELLQFWCVIQGITSPRVNF